MEISRQALILIEFTRGYLAVFFTFVALFYAVKITIAKYKSGNEQVFAGERFCTSWWNHTLFRLFRVIIWIICLFRWGFPALDYYLGIFSFLLVPCVLLTGNILLTLGFTVTIIVHLSMGEYWRSGVDPTGPRTLLTRGFFRFSRNPMFTAIAVAQLGFFLALPSVFSLICLLVGVLSLVRQIRVEEAHLSQAYPVAYTDYLLNVRRWF